MTVIFGKGPWGGKAGTPTPFHDAGTGFGGWRQQLPSQREAVTPCVDGGRLFLGAGFGSHSFHAFDARSGACLWDRPTNDDGPTAAVVAGGFVVFDTESCTVYVLRGETGEPVWQSWLGDPLLAQPCVAGGRVLMAHPDGAGRHMLAALDLAHGGVLWRAELPADVVSAPVAAAGLVYCTTLDGAVHCLELASGAVRWQRELRATSAPWVWKGEVFVSQREERAGAEDDDARESVGAVDPRREDELSHREILEAKSASYLVSKRRSGVHVADLASDASIGWGTPPPAAKLHYAEALLGATSVWRTWSHQGSRPCVGEGRLFTITGDELTATDLASGRELWRWQAGARRDGERALTPPVVTNGRVYAGTRDGRILSWEAESGALRWSVEAGAPVVWQPVVSEGWVYAGLAGGGLLGLSTGDPGDDGWPMWGGGPGHNGAEGV